LFSRIQLPPCTPPFPSTTLFRSDQVRQEDRQILESGPAGPTPEDEQAETARSAEDKAESRRKRNRRHVWVTDGEFLRAVEVVTRSEEHTSELQSPYDLVCRLLLE